MAQIIQYITIYFTIFLSLFLGYNPDNVTATVNNTVTVETQILSVTVKNETRRIVIQSGVAITAIEQKIDNEWRNIGNVNAIPEIAHIFYPTVEQTHEVSLKDAFDIESLSVGEYRLVVPYDSEGARISYAYFTVCE